jgi:nucleoside-diphosphate-sugar epimerase
MKKILVTGAFGQIGSELVPTLQQKYGQNSVIALGHQNYPPDFKGIFEAGNVNDSAWLKGIIEKYQIDTVFHLAAFLSVKSEMDPQGAWEVNVGGLKNILDISVEKKLQLFWPSSIAVFGPTTPKQNTPQTTVIEPTSMYGVNKLIGESLIHYYHLKYGLDVRSVRYPGLLDYKTPPSLGTTEYAKEIFWKAIQEKSYICPLRANTTMPMMFMLDAIAATIKIMEAPADQIKVRTSYNLAAFSFSPEELYNELKKYVPDLTIEYKETEIQKIADSWPQTIDDSVARAQWGWKPQYGMSELVKEMYTHIKAKIENAQ